MKNIDTYNEIVHIRTMLKAVQQLSWDIQSVEKRYPLMELNEEELGQVLEIYRDLFQRLTELVPQLE